MTMETARPSSWRPRSIRIGVCLVFLLQVGLIFWLGEKQPVYPRRPAPSPVLQLADNCNSEFLTLSDPTLFALPHQEGFSGAAWLKPPPPASASFLWIEDNPPWMDLSVAQLDAPFARIALSTNYSLSLETAALPEPQLLLPRISPAHTLSSRSSLRVEGALGLWKPLKSLDLPSWPARLISATDTDLLTNSIVQLLVDGQGKPVSATLLTSSGSLDADTFALDRARTSRFEPPDGLDPNAGFQRNPLDRLCWGRLIFEWHTIPATNRAAGPPS